MTTNGDKLTMEWNLDCNNVTCGIWSFVELWLEVQQRIRILRFCSLTRINSPNLVILGQTVYALVAANPQNWGPLGPRRLGMEGVTDRLKTSPTPICVTTPNLVVLL